MSNFIGNDEQFYNALDELIARGGTAGAIAAEAKERLTYMKYIPDGYIIVPNKRRNEMSHD